MFSNGCEFQTGFNPWTIHRYYNIIFMEPIGLQVIRQLLWPLFSPAPSKYALCDVIASQEARCIRMINVQRALERISCL